MVCALLVRGIWSRSRGKRKGAGGQGGNGMAERRKPKTMRGKVLAFLGIMIALFVASNLYSINRGKRFERSFDEVLTRDRKSVV